MTFKTQLRDLLNSNDTTVAQLARATKVSAKTIYSWLSGQEPSDLRNLKRVAQYFDVTLDFLVFGEVSKPSRPLSDFKEEIDAGLFEVVLRKVKK